MPLFAPTTTTCFSVMAAAVVRCLFVLFPIARECRCMLVLRGQQVLKAVTLLPSIIVHMQARLSHQYTAPSDASREASGSHSVAGLGEWCSFSINRSFRLLPSAGKLAIQARAKWDLLG